MKPGTGAAHPLNAGFLWRKHDMVAFEGKFLTMHTRDEFKEDCLMKNSKKSKGDKSNSSRPATHDEIRAYTGPLIPERKILIDNIAQRFPQFERSCWTGHREQKDFPKRMAKIVRICEGMCVKDATHLLDCTKANIERETIIG
jgi:hypothetical protein